MPLVLILPREWDILSARCADEAKANAPIMHALDSDVFQYLCANTDWATGCIGITATLSYAGIAAALNEDIPRKPNKTLRRVKRRCVRNSVERLIKAGLLVRQSLSGIDKNTLVLDRVFWCALLQTDHYQKNPDSRQIAGLINELLKHKSFNNSYLRECKKSTIADRYRPVSTYKSINITNAQNHAFRLSLTWQPDRKFVDLFLQASGFSGKQIEKVWFGKYVQYWSTQDVQRTQREWSEHFANHMQGYLLRPGYFEAVNGIVVE